MCGSEILAGHRAILVGGKGVQKTAAKLRKANKGGSQISSQLPRDMTVPGHVPSATTADTGMHCPLCPPKVTKKDFVLRDKCLC